MPVSKPTVSRGSAAGAAFWPVLLFWIAAIWHLTPAVAVNSADVSMDWMDSSYSTEYRAASVVTSLWLGAFAVTSAMIGILGAVVALQWPNPRILCYKTSYSDMPSSNARSCCSLYSLNLGFCVFWALVFAIMVIARDVVRIVVCLCFCLVHATVIAMFKMKFRRFGRPERPVPDMVMSSTSTAPGGLHDPQMQAVGIPIYNIPMQTVVVGAPADSNAAAGGARTGSNNNTSNSYWCDVACVPPQQPGMHNATQQQPAAAAAGGTGQLYPAGGLSYSLPPAGASPYPYPQDPTANYYGTTYPPQQQQAAAVGAPMVAGVAPAVPAAAGPTGGANTTAAVGDAGSAAAVAGAAAAVGAGAAATGTRRASQSG